MNENSQTSADFDKVKSEHLTDAILMMSRFFHKFTPSSTEIGSLTLRQYEAVDEVSLAGETDLHHLAEKLNLATSTTSQLVDRLVRDGYLDRRTNPDNRRKISIRLSQKGEKYLTLRKQVVEQNLGAMIGALSEENRHRFFEALHLIGLVIRESQHRE